MMIEVHGGCNSARVHGLLLWGLNMLEATKGAQPLFLVNRETKFMDYAEFVEGR